MAVGNLAVIAHRMNLPESFDRFELEDKNADSKALIRAEALPDTKWHTEFLNPVLYEKYLQGDATINITHRKVEELGVMPLKGVKIFNDQPDRYALEEKHNSAGSAQTRSDRVYIGYYMSTYAFQDYMELRNKAANYLIKGSATLPPNVSRLMNSQGYVDLMRGDYGVELKYFLPGMDQPSSKRVYNIKF